MPVLNARKEVDDRNFRYGSRMRHENSEVSTASTDFIVLPSACLSYVRHTNSFHKLLMVHHPNECWQGLAGVSEDVCAMKIRKYSKKTGEKETNLHRSPAIVRGCLLRIQTFVTTTK